MYENFQKEWILVFKYVMNFPVIVKESMLHLQEGKPSPHLLCSFLFAFARTISSYYRSTKILLVRFSLIFFFSKTQIILPVILCLQEAKPNLLPLVHARIYLIKAVQRILLAALELLDIHAIPIL